MFSNSMEKQLEEMNKEEEHDITMDHRKTYPHGLFNLVSSSVFYKIPLMRRLKAIQHALVGDAAPPYIFYDAVHDILCFFIRNSVFRRCNLHQQQFLVKSSLVFRDIEYTRVLIKE